MPSQKISYKQSESFSTSVNRTAISQSWAHRLQVQGGTTTSYSFLLNTQCSHPLPFAWTSFRRCLLPFAGFVRRDVACSQLGKFPLAPSPARVAARVYFCVSKRTVFVFSLTSSNLASVFAASWGSLEGEDLIMSARRRLLQPHFRGKSHLACSASRRLVVTRILAPRISPVLSILPSICSPESLRLSST